MIIGNLNSVIVIFLAVVITYLISPFNIAGDQASYIRVYEILSASEGDIIEAIILYRANMSGFEIFHFLYIYITSSIGLSKIFSIALANGLLVYLMNECLVNKLKIRILYSFLLIFTNYYTYALFFTLEKLKFAVIFLLMAFKIISTRKKNLYLLLAVLTHLQTVVIFIITKINDYAKKNQPLRVMRFDLGILRRWIFNIISIAIIAIVFDNYFIMKVSVYLPESLASLNYQTLSKLGCVGLISWYLAHDKQYAFICFSILNFVGLITEPQRFMMFGYGYFLYFAFTSQKKIRILFLTLSSIYYSVTAINYLMMVLETGG